eukprot:s382_g23.t3
MVFKFCTQCLATETCNDLGNAAFEVKIFAESVPSLWFQISLFCLTFSDAGLKNGLLTLMILHFLYLQTFVMLQLQRIGELWQIKETALIISYIATLVCWMLCMVKRCIPQDKMAPGQGKGKSKGKPPSYSNGSSPGGSGGYPPNYGHGYPPGGPPGYGGFGPAPGPYGVYQGCGGYGYPPYGQGYAPGTPGTPGTPGYGAPGYGGYGAYPAYPPVDSRSAPY